MPCCSRETAFLGACGSLLTSFVGVLAFASAASGWLLRKSNWIERVLLAAAGLSLVYPAVWTDILGIALGGLAVLLQLVVKLPRLHHRQQNDV